MAHQCPLEDRHKIEKITKLVEENILFKLSYEFFCPRSIYFCEKNSFITILGTLKLKIKITDVSVSGHVFSHMLTLLACVVTIFNHISHSILIKILIFKSHLICVFIKCCGYH